MKLPNDSPFQEVKDEDIIKDVLQSAFKKGLPFTFWVKDQVFQFPTKLSGLNRERLFVDLPISVDETEWDDFVAHHSQNSEFYLLGTVDYKKFQFFMRFLVSGREHRTIKLHHPKSLFKLQRRKSARVRLPAASQSGVRFLKPLSFNELLQCQIYDISSGGISFEVSNALENLFKKGTDLERMTFTLKNKVIECEAVVKHLAPVGPASNPSAYRVGAQFIGLSPIYEKIINAFIADADKKAFSEL